MNRDTHDLTPRTDPDATLVTIAAAAPIFTEQSVETARPVVPLNNGAANVAAGVSSRVGIRRPSWLLGLIAVSVLAGTVVGGLGLRFYQRRQRAAAAVSAQTVATPTTAPDFSPTPSVAVETESVQAGDPTAEAPFIIEAVEGDGADATTTTTAPPADDSRSEDARSNKSDEKRADEKSAKPDKASRAGQNGDVDHRGARQKNDRDDDRERGGTERAEQQRPRRTQSSSATRAEGERVAQNAGGDDDAPGPRRIDRIRDIMGGSRRRPQQQRRDERRREQAPAGTVDRVRGIFEGRPPE